MPDTKSAPTIVAILGLLVSISGNVIQWRLAASRDVELKQAQDKINQGLRETEDRNRKMRSLLTDLEQRITTLDQQIRDQDREASRGMTAIAYGHPQEGQAIMDAALDKKRQLEADRKALQDKLDAANLIAATEHP